MANAECVIVVDLGTTYFKICRFDLEGQLDVSHTVPSPAERSQDGRVEINVDRFRDCLKTAVRHLANCGNKKSNVRAITFATQANSFALFDNNNHPITPFILWSDSRARDTEFPLQQLALTNEFKRITGVAEVNHLFMPAKLHWLAAHQPEIFGRTQRIAFLSDYFTYWLTGQWVTEAATAALSGLVDIRTLQWWTKGCSAAAIPQAWLPQIVRAGTDLGSIQPNAAYELQLPKDCRFIVGCLDQHAGAIGAGNITPGGVSETTGTVLATVRCTNSLAEPEGISGVFQGPAFAEGIYYQMVFSEQSAGILERYRNETAKDLRFTELDQLAAESPRGARGLKLRPDAYLLAPGSFFDGRQLFHTRGDEVRAILEGVAAELARQVNLLCHGQPPSVIHAAGGGAKSQRWLTIKTEAIGVPVEAVDCCEPTSAGAASLTYAHLRPNEGTPHSTRKEH